MTARQGGTCSLDSHGPSTNAGGASCCHCRLSNYRHSLLYSTPVHVHERITGPVDKDLYLEGPLHAVLLLPALTCAVCRLACLLLGICPPDSSALMAVC